MSEQVENQILEYLRAIRGDIAVIKQGLKDLQMRVARLEVLVANVVSDLLRVNGRLDAVDRRIERIESRLGLIA